MEKDDAVVAEVGPVQARRRVPCAAPSPMAPPSIAPSTCVTGAVRSRISRRTISSGENEAEQDIRQSTAPGEGLELKCRIADRRDKDQHARG